MKKISRLIGKIVYSTALKAAEKEVNSACTTKFYQEKLDAQTEVLRKYHDEKNS